MSAEEAEVAAQAAKCKALKDDALADLVGGVTKSGGLGGMITPGRLCVPGGALLAGVWGE